MPKENILTQQTLMKILKSLEKYPTFVKKPIFGLGGGDVEKLSVDQIKNKREFYEALKDKNEFIEELIIQDERWGKLSPNSTNTIRVMTVAVNGKSRIMFTAARIGSGKNITDNFHQGGQGVFIDMDTGKFVRKWD